MKSFLTRSAVRTHRNRFLSEVVTLHLQLLVLLQRAVEEDDDVDLGGLKCIGEELHEFKAAIELAATSPVCVKEKDCCCCCCCGHETYGAGNQSLT